MTDDSLIDFHIGLGGPAQRGFLKRFDILQPVAHLVAQLEKHGAVRFGAPTFQCGLTDPPAFGQLGLGHASSVHRNHPSVTFVGTPLAGGVRS